MTVYVCSEKDVACGEVSSANRCARCPLRAPTSPAAPAPVMELKQPEVVNQMAEWPWVSPAPAQPSDVQMQQDAARYRWLRERGTAFYADPKRHLENGYVYRFTNLDAAIDAAIGKTTGSKGERHHSKCGVYNFAGDGKCTCGYDRLPKRENAMNADRLTDERIKQLASKASRDFNEDRDPSPAHLFARAVESAVRSQYEADLRQAREALVIAHSQMAHKLQCFTVRPTTEWNEHGSVSFGGCSCEIKAVRAALAALDARLGEQRETAVSPAADPQRNNQEN